MLPGAKVVYSILIDRTFKLLEKKNAEFFLYWTIVDTASSKEMEFVIKSVHNGDDDSGGGVGDALVTIFIFFFDILV